MMVTPVLMMTLWWAQQYEEKVLETLPLREKLYQQMKAHADRLVLRQRIGYPPPGMAAGGAMRVEKTGEDAGVTYYRTYLPVGQNVEAYGLLLVPKKLAAKRAPLVIAMHGGGGSPEMATYMGGANYKDMVRGAAAQGYVVYAPHSVMYPFRDRDAGTTIPADVRRMLDERFREAGTSLAAVEVYKVALALDALLARADVDPKRVAMIGLSYGGFYSTYVAALEPRIGVVAASCSFVDEPERGTGKTEGRLFDLTPPQMGALIAPRPLLVQSGKLDKLMPIEDSRRLAERVRFVYEKVQSEDRFVFKEFEGGHEFYGEDVWAFLKKWL